MAERPDTDHDQTVLHVETAEVCTLPSALWCYTYTTVLYAWTFEFDIWCHGTLSWCYFILVSHSILVLFSSSY